jgi:hypothetical protein
VSGAGRLTSPYLTPELLEQVTERPIAHRAQILTVISGYTIVEPMDCGTISPDATGSTAEK